MFLTAKEKLSQGLMERKAPHSLSRRVTLSFLLFTVCSVVFMSPIKLEAQPSTHTQSNVQSIRRQIETERTNALDRLIAISDKITKAELLQSLSLLRISEVKTFISDHLAHPDHEVRRAAYFGLAMLSFVSPASWVPAHLKSIDGGAYKDRIAICDALALSLHPHAASVVLDVYSSLTLEPTAPESLMTLDHCLSAGLTLAHQGRPLRLSRAQALRLTSLKPLTPTSDRALNLISLLHSSPHLIDNEDRADIVEYFNEILRDILRLHKLSMRLFAIKGLSTQELLSVISPWWGIGRLSLDYQSNEFSSAKERDRYLLITAEAMGSEETAPLSPIILQKWLDRLEQYMKSGQVPKLSRALSRRSVIPYLQLFRSLLNLRRHPKTLAREARRGLRILDDLKQLNKATRAARAHYTTNDHVDGLIDQQLYQHLKCHLSALVDHSVRRLRLLPGCIEHSELLPVVYLLSRRTMSQWGTHAQTRSLKRLYELHKSFGSSAHFGAEQLTQTLVTLTPMGRRKTWVIDRIKEALNQSSLISQIAIEAIAEHHISSLQSQVSDRIEDAFQRDEYAVIMIGMKCLEMLNSDLLWPWVHRLIQHHYPEIRLLGYALQSRAPTQNKTQALHPSSTHTLQRSKGKLKGSGLAWGQRSNAQTLRIQLSTGEIVLRVSPHAFNLLKTLELAIVHKMFETGVVTQKSQHRVTFSAHLDREWSSWIYPPRSEPSDRLNPLPLHHTWVLTWDPLIFDHYKEGWVFSRSTEALDLMKHGVIAEVIEGAEYLETALIGDRSLSATISTQ